MQNGRGMGLLYIKRTQRNYLLNHFARVDILNFKLFFVEGGREVEWSCFVFIVYFASPPPACHDGVELAYLRHYLAECAAERVAVSLSQTTKTTSSTHDPFLSPLLSHPPSDIQV